MSMIYRQLSIVERKRGQLEAALHYALKSIEMAEETTNLETYYQASREVAEVYQSTGDYKTAYEYEKRLAETKRQQLSSIFDQQLGDMEAYIELEKNLLHKKQEFDQLELFISKKECLSHGSDHRALRSFYRFCVPAICQGYSPDEKNRTSK